MKKLFILSIICSLLASQPLTEIFIIGNKKTKESIILREIHQIIPGQLNKSVLTEDQNRIYNLGIFSDVHIQAIDQRYTIIVHEAFSFMPVPLIDFDEMRGWSYGAGFAHINFRGINEKLMLGYKGGGSTTYFFTFDNPWITGNHITANFRGYQKNLTHHADSTILVERLIELGSGFNLGFHQHFSFRVGYIDQEINSYLNKQYIVSKQSYEYDNRDIYIDPTQGCHFTLNFEQNWSIGQSSSIYKIGSEYSIYRSIDLKKFNPVFSSTSKISFNLSSEILTDFNLQYLGGEDFVRGYSPIPIENDELYYDQIEWENILYQSFQLQYSIFKRQNFNRMEIGLDGLFFVDFGIGFNKLSEYPNNALIGLGVGFRYFVSGFGSVGIDIGFNPKGQHFLHLSEQQNSTQSY